MHPTHLIINYIDGENSFYEKKTNNTVQGLKYILFHCSENTENSDFYNGRV